MNAGMYPNGRRADLQSTRPGQRLVGPTMPYYAMPLHRPGQSHVGLCEIINENIDAGFFKCVSQSEGTLKLKTAEKATSSYFKLLRNSDRAGF